MRWFVLKLQDAPYAEAFRLYAQEEGLALTVLQGDPTTALLVGVRIAPGHELEALWAPYIVSWGQVP